MSVNPPRPRLPPLNALRAFESAARLGGFSNAAEELSVSPGAISQQVKILEDWAGVSLFDRKAQGVSLSAAGRTVQADLVEAFDKLGGVAQNLKAQSAKRLLIAALPAVAQLWLTPRLGALRAALPNRDISVTALETPPNLLREPFSASLYILPRGQGIELCKDALQPVCSPKLAMALQHPEDLKHLPCLTDTTWADEWQQWWSQAGSGGTFVPQGPRYSLYSMAVAEACAGAGVLMGHMALLEHYLDAGQLVAPLDIPIDNGLALSAQISSGGQTAELVDQLKQV